MNECTLAWLGWLLIVYKLENDRSTSAQFKSQEVNARECQELYIMPRQAHRKIVRARVDGRSVQVCKEEARQGQALVNVPSCYASRNP